jgi:hypothetical protein
MDDSVNHICNVIGVNGMTRSKMVQCGISTIDQLMAIREERNEGSLRYKHEGGIRSDVFNNLLLAVKWMKENPGKDVMDNFTDDVFDKLFMDNDDRDFVKDAKEDGDAIPTKENKKDKKDVQYYSIQTRCLDCEYDVVQELGDVLWEVQVGRTVHFAKKCRVLDCMPTCKKHARHDPRDTTWIEWVTTGRLELVFNTQILGYWKENKKRKRHSPKRFMNEQSPDGK